VGEGPEGRRGRNRSVRVRLMLRRDAACRRFGTPSPNVSHSSAMTHDCLLERSKVDRQLFLLSLSLSLMEKGQGLLRCTSSFLFAPTDESIFRIYLPQCNYHRDRGDTSERSPRAVATRILLTTPLRPSPPPRRPAPTPGSKRNLWMWARWVMRACDCKAKPGAIGD
jgi:hypothetical protein